MRSSSAPTTVERCRSVDASREPRSPYADIVADLVAGDIDLADCRLAAILAENAEDADALGLAARVAGMRSERGAEIALLRRALAVRPEDGSLLAMHARCLVRNAAPPTEADVAIRAALAGPALSDIALDELATACRLLGRHHDAADLLTRAVAEGSRNPAIFYNLGNNLKFVGDFDAARAAYRRAIDLAPDFHKVHAALAALGGGEKADLTEIERLITTSADPEALIHLRHAAAKRCDAAGQYDAAWTHLRAGKTQLVRALRADPSAALSSMDRLIDTLERGAFNVGATADPTGPILVLGMPRSGTTVLDRMVSNHSQVTSIGESMLFAHLLKTACGSTSSSLLDAAVIEALADRDLLCETGRAYTERLSLAVEPAVRFLDKFHLNILLAPHLAAALPQARLLCVVRDPLDTIVGNFRQLFEFRSTIYSYSLDIAAAAEFYVRFRRITDLMQAASPERFAVVEYERLVANPEREARRIFQFCGLPWQADCSRIERNQASVATASAVQVRSGIDGSYIGRWRHYADHLGEARRILEHAGLLAC